MRVLHIDNLEKFFDVVDKCTGKVELVSGEDMRLNLKSKLTQYFALAELFSGGKEIPELEIETEKAEDAERIIQFMIG